MKKRTIFKLITSSILIFSLTSCSLSLPFAHFNKNAGVETVTTNVKEKNNNTTGETTSDISTISTLEEAKLVLKGTNIKAYKDETLEELLARKAFILTYAIDGTETDVTDDANYVGFESSKTGKITVIASYEGKNVSININIIRKDSLLISESSITAYKDETFSTLLSREAFHLLYDSNGTISDVTNYASYSGYDSSKVGTTTVMASYNGLSITFTINVINK